MDQSGRTINLVMILIVLLFLTLGFGGMAAYSVFSRGRQTVVSPAASSTETRLVTRPSLAADGATSERVVPRSAATPSLTAPSIATPSTGQCTNDSVLVADMTAPDDSEFQPGQAFEKTWRIKNSGTCAWNSSYKFVFVDGSRMGATAEIAVPDTSSGATAELKVRMTAPTKTGVSAALWQMEGPSGEHFGPTFNLTIRVRGSGARGCNGTPVIASFLANPPIISPGQSSTLSWGMVSNANAAEIDNGIGGIATPGGLVVSPRRTTTYTLTARCGQNITQAQVTITIE